jgi:O-antigen ligase
MLGAFFSYYMFIFAAFWLLRWQKFPYWLLLIPFLLCFRGIQVTFSRGAYVAFLAGGFALAFFRSKIFFVLCVIAMFLAIINPVLLPAGMRRRMESTFVGGELYSGNVEDIKDASASQRITIWKGGIEIIKDYPWLGVGYGVFSDVIGFYAPTPGADAHNSYITIAAEMGIPALLVFVIIILLVFKKTLWLYRRSSDFFMKAVALGFLGGIAGLLMANMFGSRLIEEQVSSYFWMLAALIIRSIIIEKREQAELRSRLQTEKKAQNGPGHA